jgi:two-component system response regulator NreC
MNTRILVVDDNKPFRDGLKALIGLQARMEVIGEAENGEIAVELAGRLRPDVILMDVKMPVMDGVEATRLIHADMPGVKILALSMYSDKIYVMGMLRAGAVGYITKGDDLEEMFKTIRKVASSEKS